MIQYSIVSASHSSVVVDHESDPSSSSKPVLFLGLSAPRGWPWIGIPDDLVQSRGNLRVQHLEVWKVLSTNWSRGFQLVLRINRLHFDQQHNIRCEIITGGHLIFDTYFHTKKDCGSANLSNWNSDICPTMKLCGNSTGSIKELAVDGLVANVGIGVVPWFSVSSPVWKVFVLPFTGTASRFLCAHWELIYSMFSRSLNLSHFVHIDDLSISETFFFQRQFFWQSNLFSSRFNKSVLCVLKCQFWLLRLSL